MADVIHGCREVGDRTAVFPHLISFCLRICMYVSVCGYVLYQSVIFSGNLFKETKLQYRNQTHQQPLLYPLRLAPRQNNVFTCQICRYRFGHYGSRYKTVKGVYCMASKQFSKCAKQLEFKMQFLNCRLQHVFEKRKNDAKAMMMDLIYALTM